MSDHGTCSVCGTKMVKLPVGLNAYRIFCPNGRRFPTSMCAHNDGIIVPYPTSSSIQERR